MTALTIKSDQKPAKEALKRLSEQKDEDIVYDDDCPEMTPKMQKVLELTKKQKSKNVKDGESQYF